MTDVDLHSTQKQGRALVTDPTLCEPFNGKGRNAGRLLHDFGAMLSLLNPDMLASPTLDFGAGSCWITESLAKMGQEVVAFDIHANLGPCIAGRVKSDARIDPALIKHQQGDGHDMPFPNGTFGHLLCYDTLHHMHDYGTVFKEFSRVLKPLGRAIFVEPGAIHSKSPETVAFMKTMTHDPSWIERDVVLEEINRCALNAGFDELTIVPMQHPVDLMRFTLTVWSQYRRGHTKLRAAVADRLSNTNYNERVIFYCDKPAD